MNKYIFNLVFTFSVFFYLCIEAKDSVANEVHWNKSQISQTNDSNTTSATTPENNENGDSVEVKLEDLRVPDGPALNIIGSPKIEISKPGTPRAFGLSLIESFTDSESSIPQNLAIDLAPYWWSKRALNTLDDEICRPSSAKDKATECKPISFGESLWRSLTISIASSAEDFELEEESIDLTRLGLGIRFSLLSGRVNPAFSEKYNSFPKENFCAFKIVNGKKQPFTNDQERIQCAREKLTNLGAELEKLSSTRVGWQLDFALASALDFQKDNFDNAEFTRLGTWLTASYRPINSQSNPSSITFLGIARYLYDDFDNQANDLFDLGGRILWNPTDNPLSGSIEYLRRFGNEDDDRLVGLAEYNFNDTYSIFASFGKTFEEDFTGNDDLVTLLGINFGLGQKPKALVNP